MVDLAELDRVPEGADDVLLADHLVEGAGAVAAVEREHVGHPRGGSGLQETRYILVPQRSRGTLDEGRDCSRRDRGTGVDGADDGDGRSERGRHRDVRRERRGSRDRLPPVPARRRLIQEPGAHRPPDARLGWDRRDRHRRRERLHQGGLWRPDLGPARLRRLRGPGPHRLARVRGPGRDAADRPARGRSARGSRGRGRPAHRHERRLLRGRHPVRDRRARQARRCDRARDRVEQPVEHPRAPRRYQARVVAAPVRGRCRHGVQPGRRLRLRHPPRIRRELREWHLVGGDARVLQVARAVVLPRGHRGALVHHPGDHRHALPTQPGVRQLGGD